MKEVTMYVTDDGKVFEEKEDAMAYEAKQNRKKVLDAIDILKKHCKSYTYCEDCFLYGNTLACKLAETPASWKIEK